MLLRDHGLSPGSASIAIGVHGLGALIGMGSAGTLMERFGAGRVLVPALVLGAVATAALGFMASSLVAVSVAVALVGLTVGMGASGSIALASVIYPTAIRGTGVGWAMGMGRFGQVLTPLLAVAMVGAGWDGTQLFLGFAIAPLLGAAAVLALRGGRADALGNVGI